MNRVLITGSCGFVGTHLTRYFAASGYEVWALDLAEAHAAQKAVIINSSDICSKRYDWNELDAISWESLDTVVHLAGKAHDTSNVSDPQSYYDVNVGLTDKVVTRCKKGRINKSFIYFSSVKAVADHVDGVLTEESCADPQTPYGRSQLEAEKIVQHELMNDNVKEGSLENIMEERARVQVWISKDVWAIPLSLGWVHDMRHFFLQILCFNLTIDFK